MTDNTTLFLGAGFSYSAGLPLTKELFKDIPYYPIDKKKLKPKKILELKYESVIENWQKWARSNNPSNPELWIRDLYLDIEKSEESRKAFNNVVDFIAARVVNIPGKYGANGAYYYGISTSVISDIHRNFWLNVRSKFNISKIITTNFDILIEQGLRDEYSDSSNNRVSPLCRYGGFPYSFEQRIRIMKNLTAREDSERFRYDILGRGNIELFKLHGSVNWVEEEHGFKIHDDVRAVFRTKDNKGALRIIPPLEEKKKPRWAYDVWNYAQKALSENDIWFVCGYSFPTYDKAVLSLFKNAFDEKKQVFIADPDSERISKNLKSIFGTRINVKILPGLPELNDEIAKL